MSGLYGQSIPPLRERMRRATIRKLESYGMEIPEELKKPITGVKPIETEYKGYKFRSRLEARWAVFFDTAGIVYQYEPEGFVLRDGTHYLPDFYLPWFNAYVEIKPISISREKEEEAREKIRQLFSLEEKRVGMLFKGDPMDNCMSVFVDYCDAEGGGENWFAGGFYEGCWFHDDPDLHPECEHPEFFEGEYGKSKHFITFNASSYNGKWLRFGGMCIENQDRCYEYRNDFFYAKSKARHARFEHGECAG